MSDDARIYNDMNNIGESGEASRVAEVVADDDTESIFSDSEMNFRGSDTFDNISKANYDMEPRLSLQAEQRNSNISRNSTSSEPRVSFTGRSSIVSDTARSSYVARTSMTSDADWSCPRLSENSIDSFRSSFANLDQMASRHSSSSVTKVDKVNNSSDIEILSTLLQSIGGQSIDQCLQTITGITSYISRLETRIKEFEEATVDLVASEEEFFKLVKAGNCNAIRIRSLHFLSINVVDVSGMTALHWASANNNMEMAKIIIEMGGDINVRDTKGLNTPLLTAAKYGHAELVGFLIFSGADINAQNAEGETPLVRAIFNNHPDTATILLKCNADVSLRKVSGESAIGLAYHANLVGVINHILSISTKEVDELLCLAAQHGNVDIVRCLDLLVNIPVNAVARSMSALHWASAGGRTQFVKFLLLKGATVDIREETCQNTPLMTSAKYGFIEIIQMLLDNRADINAQNADGETALMRAIVHRHPSTATFFINNGANLHIKNNAGKTALSLALELADQERNPGLVGVATLLVSKGALLSHFNSLTIAAQRGNLEILKLGIKANIPIDSLDGDGMSALHRCVGAGKMDAVKLLLQNHCMVDIKDALAGNTPLSTASKYGHSEIAQLLIDSGANINTQNNLGETPLIRAMIANNPATCRLLLDNDPDLTLLNADGKNALQLSLDMERTMISNLIKRKMSNDLIK